MRRFTHTFPQRISAFLLCLALCLGLLPVTALAAAPPENQVLYVGGVLISSTGYWTTDSNGNVTEYTGEGTPTDNYIHYDAGDNTLTLHNATIKEALDYGDDPPNSLIFGAAIGVLNQNGAAELTITLEGTNTIAEDGKGIYVLASSTSTGGATLTITGGGSLTASGSVNAGILVQSNGGNATLSIENAEVTTTSSSSDGVLVQAKDGSNASLTVNGGSLTATGSGTTFAGIQLQIGSSDNGSGTPSLNVSNSAIVRANGSAGGITSNSSTSIQYKTGSDSTGGIVFDGNTGTVYGAVTLREDLEIGEGESLTIPEGSTLNTNGNLTNNGTIVNKGTLEGNLTGDTGTVVNAPAITTNSLPEGTVNQPYTATLTATGNNITWSLASGSTMPAGLTLNSDGTISGIPTAEGSSTFTVTAENSAGSATQEYTLNIKPATVSVTGVTLNKTSTELAVGQSETLTAAVEPSNATNQKVTWSSSAPGVATVDTNGKVTAVGAGTAQITVTTADGSKTATCAVTVEKPYTPPPYIPPTYAVTTPDTTGGTVEVSPSRASSGRRVTITTQPAPGYELESLTVLDSRGSEIALTAQGDGKYTFTMPSSRVTVEASFAPVPLPFEDVAPGAWYEEAVRYAYLHDIMEGMSATTFVPNKSLTRAEAVQVLYNLEGQPTVSGTATFPDLVYEWYKPAISWAESTGVVDGYEDGTFHPDQPVTRQEFAQMLYDYASYKDYDLTAEGDLSAFPDGSQVQDWALPAMTWANGNALINGHDDGTLEPGGTTIRAQAASILMRFDQKLVE